MQFIDHAEVQVQAGNGGDGLVPFDAKNMFQPEGHPAVMEAGVVPSFSRL